MHCPFCRHPDSRVVDSRETDEGQAIRRRRSCPQCGRRFTTVETAVLAVVKRSGVTEPFSREKVINGVRRACQGRQVDDDARERAVLADELRTLADARGANGQAIYPELNSDNPTWKGFRVLVTTQFPSNGGATTDESTLALVDWSNVLYGDEEDITVRTSMEATIDPGTGTLVHLFQQNMMAVLMEAQHDIALNYDQAVSVLRHARWGSLSAT